MNAQELDVIQELRNALVVAAENCVEAGVPEQNSMQFLSLVEAALEKAEQAIGADYRGSVDSMVSRWKRNYKRVGR